AADLGLQLMDLLAERRLGDVQPGCGTAKVQLLGDGNEIAQLTKFHGTSLIRRPDQSCLIWYWTESVGGSSFRPAPDVLPAHLPKLRRPGGHRLRLRWRDLPA